MKIYHSNFNLAARLNIVLAVDPLDGRGVSLALGGVGLCGLGWG